MKTERDKQVGPHDVGRCVLLHSLADSRPSAMHANGAFARDYGAQATPAAWAPFPIPRRETSAATNRL